MGEPRQAMSQGMSGSEHKAAFRRWARENHPDVGGDPAVFAEGLKAAREGRWQTWLAGSSPSDEPDPETRGAVYVRRTARGVAKVIVAAQRWNARRKSPPRVR